MNIAAEARKVGMAENTLRSRLRRGWTLDDAIAKPVATKHGMDGTRTYDIWKSMVQRCRDKNCKAYPNYGGRGISVCERWMDFRNFFSDLGEIKAPLTIDRINNDGNYCLANVRLVPKKEQNRNRRDNKLVRFNGETHCLSEWAELYGIPYSTFHYRLKAGWKFKDALTIPVGMKHEILRMNGIDPDA